LSGLNGLPLLINLIKNNLNISNPGKINISKTKKKSILLSWISLLLAIMILIKIIKPTKLIPLFPRKEIFLKLKKLKIIKLKIKEKLSIIIKI
tara:strand:+ start:79 stop:357 length:279 start_codon:yes stop_codon:yes gene_type:complete